MPTTRPIPQLIGLWGAPITLMIVIYALSAQPDLNSGLGVVDLIGRKLIHAGEYALLCFLWWRVLVSYIGNGRGLVLALVVSISYACTDEYHQRAVHGRHASVLDVGIDSLGALLSAALIRRRQRGLAPPPRPAG